MDSRSWVGRGPWKARYSPFKRASYSPPPRWGEGWGGGSGRLATRLSNGPLTRLPRVGGGLGGAWKAHSLLAFPNGPLTRLPRVGGGLGGGPGRLATRLSNGPLTRLPRVGEGWEGALEGSLATRLSKRASYSPPPRRGRVGRGPGRPA